MLLARTLGATICEARSFRRSGELKDKGMSDRPTVEVDVVDFPDRQIQFAPADTFENKRRIAGKNCDSCDGGHLGGRQKRLHFLGNFFVICERSLQPSSRQYQIPQSIAFFGLKQGKEGKSSAFVTEGRMQ